MLPVFLSDFCRTLEQEMAKKRHPAFWSYLKGMAEENSEFKNTTKQNTIPKCKYCGSSSVIRYGYYSGIQRWWCKECKRKFADNKAPPGMKTPYDEMAFALTMYYEGMSLNIIRRNLQQIYNSYPSDSTLYDWIERFTKKAIAADRKHKPRVGDVWIADETPLMIGDRKAWFWDIIDIKTGFILASRLSSTRSVDTAQALIMKAVKKAKKQPKVVVSCNLVDYINGIEVKLETETGRIAAKTLYTASGIQMVVRLRSSHKARAEIVERFKNISSARTIIQGWPVHHNYLRPHEITLDNTPAHRAGIKQPLKIKIR